MKRLTSKADKKTPGYAITLDEKREGFTQINLRPTLQNGYTWWKMITVFLTVDFTDRCYRSYWSGNLFPVLQFGSLDALVALFPYRYKSASCKYMQPLRFLPTQIILCICTDAYMCNLNCVPWYLWWYATLHM